MNVSSGTISSITISNAIAAYCKRVAEARSENTARTYLNGMNLFRDVLVDHDVNPDKALVTDLSEDAVAWVTSALKNNAATTERLYLTAITGFYEYLSAENLAPINLPRVRQIIKLRARRPGQRLPQFPRNSIEQVLEYCDRLKSTTGGNEGDHLRNLRDRAFLITLAHTGLRVHEACALRRGDIDWYEGQALIIGKGNQQAVVRFSRQSLSTIKEYLDARAILDGASGRPLSSLPIFARHDKGAGKKIMPMTTTTGRNIVSDRVRECLGEKAVGTITPHSFRHYFVTTVLRASGNLKLAQELARHKNIAITQRYAHLSNDELDRGYSKIFDAENRSDPEDTLTE